MTSLSVSALTNLNGPEPMGCRVISSPLPSGTMPIAPSETFHSNAASGSFKWKITVKSSGASM